MTSRERITSMKRWMLVWFLFLSALARAQYFPPTEGEPAGMTVNGVPGEVLIEGARVRPFPGVDGWYVVSNGTVTAYYHGRDRAFTQVVNRTSTRQAAVVDGRVIGLDPWSGFAWLNTDWFNRVGAAGAPTNPMDDWIAQRIFAPDQPVTRWTGSGNMNFSHPILLWGQRYGASRQVLRYLIRYECLQRVRPRWWLDAEGVPVAINPAAVVPATWQGEWHENWPGWNPGDAQHHDLLESHAGYILTGWPFFLAGEINYWTFSARLFPAWRCEEGNNYGGSVRVPGQCLASSSYVTRDLPLDPAYGALRQRIAETVAWHLDNCASQGIIWHPWFSGGCSMWYKDNHVNYQFPYQIAWLMWGTLEVADSFPELEGLAISYAQFLGDWLEECLREDGAMAVERAEDGSHTVWDNGNCMTVWAVAPMLRFEQRQGDQGWALPDRILEILAEHGDMNPYDWEGVTLAAPALGWDLTIPR